MLWQVLQEFQGSLLDKQRRKHFLQCPELQEADGSGYEKCHHMEVKSRLPGFESQLCYFPPAV